MEENLKIRRDDITSTYTYLPLAELLNDLTNYKNTDPQEKGVKYIMDEADVKIGFDDSMNFNHLLASKIEPSDYDKGGGRSLLVRNNGWFKSETRKEDCQGGKKLLLSLHINAHKFNIVSI